GVFPLSTVMLSLIDQLLVLGPLRRRELPVDLAAHARFEGIKAGPHLRPQCVGFGTMTGKDRAHRIALRRAEVQLLAEIVDDRVWVAAAAATQTRSSTISARSWTSARRNAIRCARSLPVIVPKPTHCGRRCGPALIPSKRACAARSTGSSRRRSGPSTSN